MFRGPCVHAQPVGLTGHAIVGQDGGKRGGSQRLQGIWGSCALLVINCRLSVGNTSVDGALTLAVLPSSPKERKNPNASALT